MDEGESNTGLPKHLQILTEDEMLRIGLTQLGWSDDAINRVNLKTNHDRFVGQFGAKPHVLAKLWEDLQSTPIEEARIDPTKHSIHLFLATMHYMYRYPTEIERCNIWKVCRTTTRKWTWFFVDRIRALKAGLFGWPADNFGSLKWVMSVDGTHFVTEEPNDPEIPKDPAYFSFKHHSAGFNYEIGLSLTESKIIWMSGPWPAGEWNDIKIFRDKGLAWLLRQHKKMVIADNGYRGYPSLASTPNPYDAPDVALFKSRARTRQEALNFKFKNFECLSSRFRATNPGRLEACIEAVAVVVQYKMDGGEPLFNI